MSFFFNITPNNVVAAVVVVVLVLLTYWWSITKVETLLSAVIALSQFLVSCYF